MADVKISALPASTVALAGTEVLPIVQSSVTKQVSVANLTAGRAVAALNLSTSGSTSTTPVLSFNATNCNIASGATVANTYLQAVMQNKSGTAGASTNWAVSNDLGTDSTYYGEMGMNSSVFSASTPADYFSINNGIYFSGHDGDISYGSGNGFKTYLAWGTTGQSAHVINATGALGFSTNLGTTPALSGTTGYGTAGQALISAASAAAPAWGNLGTSAGGTGLSGASPFTSTGIVYASSASALATGSVLTLTSSALKVNNAQSNQLNLLTSSTGNTQAIQINNGSNYNYGIVGIVSGTGTSGGDVFGLGYSGNANSTFTPVLVWNSIGNVGLTTNPSTAWSSVKALEISGMMLSASATTNYIGQNVYLSAAGQYTYKATATAALYTQSAGAHAWYYAASGTAATTISFTETMGLDTSGNLTIAGATATKASGTTWANPSDVRLKDNISDFTKGLTELQQVNVKTWNYNGKAGTNIGTKGMGVIADEIMQLLPETVDTYKAKLNPEDEIETDIKRFNATEITWLLVNAVKELNAKFESYVASHP